MGFELNKGSFFQLVLCVTCYYCSHALLDDVKSPTKTYLRFSFLSTAAAALLGTLRFGGVRRLPVVEADLTSLHEKVGSIAKSLGIVALGLGCVSLVLKDPISFESPIALASMALGLVVLLATFANHNDPKYITALQVAVTLVMLGSALNRWSYAPHSAQYVVVGIACSVLALVAHKKSFGDLSGRDVFLILYSLANLAFGFAAKHR